MKLRVLMLSAAFFLLVFSAGNAAEPKAAASNPPPKYTLTCSTAASGCQINCTPGGTFYAVSTIYLWNLSGSQVLMQLRGSQSSNGTPLERMTILFSSGSCTMPNMIAK
jgi:hypothetical protein